MLPVDPGRVADQEQLTISARTRLSMDGPIGARSVWSLGGRTNRISEEHKEHGEDRCRILNAVGDQR